ncbi:MAG: TonB-dependent receptor domain-containing protein [Cryomorphaceae bacterium]|nr:TonB-dependent receptor [Flavobacteriales bacterium]
MSVKFSILSVFLLLTFFQSFGAEVRGVVSDKQTREPLTGAMVLIAGTQLHSVTGLDGSYNIKNVPKGKHTLEVSFISFERQRIEINVSEGNAVIVDVQMAESGLDLGEVEIVGRMRQDNDRSARASEKNADNVINVISAKTIEVSPDITVANVVQRVSGVSLERNNNGDGQHAIVRGMDKRYNYTLVNGIKIPSPETRNRYVPLDIFPSDLLERLEVTKALTPSMEGDAIGGVIDMKMKSAPDRFTLNVNIGTGYNQMYFDRPFTTWDRSGVPNKSPRALNGNDHRAGIEEFPLDNANFVDEQPMPNQIYGLSIGNRFMDGKLGVLVAGSYQNTYRGANSIFVQTDTDRETNTPSYDVIQDRQFSVQQIRTGVHAKLDYEFNRNHRIDWYNAYIGLNDVETRDRVDTNLRLGRSQGEGTGRIEYRLRSRQQIRNIYNSTLQGDHRFLGGALKVDWSAVYSLATADDPDMSELTWLSGAFRNEDGVIEQEPLIYDRVFSRRYQSNSDNDLAGYLNVTYYQDIGGLDVEFKAGGMYRHKNRDNSFDRYRLNPSPSNQIWSGSIFDAAFTVDNPGGTPTDPLNYRSQEDVLGLYGQFKFLVGNLQVLGGVRVENTLFSWDTDSPPQVPGRVGNINYMDILPSMHLKYMPTAKTNIRGSYFKSLSRPNFFEVIPYEINEEDFRERGNPFLQRTQADNLDLRWEHFPSPLDQIMVGVFYKRIDDPIESALVIEGQSIFLQPNNFGTANNFGVEFDYTKYFNKFGIRAFYTYTNSQITTSKLFRFRDDAGNLTSRTIDQTRPLQGQSDHIANASLLYKDQKSGLDLQLAMVYTGRRIIGVSVYLDNDIWQRAFTQLDFSAEKRFGKHITAYVKVNNILNTPLRADILLPNESNAAALPSVDASESVLVREDFYLQTYFIGFRYTL